MKEKSLAGECVACNCVEIGTLIDNSDCSTQVQKEFQSEAEAAQALEQLTQKANEIASDECQVNANVAEVEGKWQLTANVTFSCQAEALILELALR